jgi:uncharacterized protein (UPF0212 family)
MYGVVKADKSDGEYATAYGSYICPHCGQPFGGSLYVTQGVVLNGMIHHAACFLPAVQIMVGKHQLKTLKLDFK